MILVAFPFWSYPLTQCLVKADTMPQKYSTYSTSIRSYCITVKVFIVIVTYFSHSESTGELKTSSTRDQIRGTEVAPASSISQKQSATSPSWLSNITASTFGRKKSKEELNTSNGENRLKGKFRLVLKCKKQIDKHTGWSIYFFQKLSMNTVPSLPNLFFPLALV